MMMILIKGIGFVNANATLPINSLNRVIQLDLTQRSILKIRNILIYNNDDNKSQTFHLYHRLIQR